MRFFLNSGSGPRRIRGKWFIGLSLLLGLALLPNLPAWGGFAVEMAPARLELKVDPGKKVRAAIGLRTRSRMAQEVEVTKGYFGLTADGVPVFDKPEDASESAAGWITLSQDRLKIFPRQRKRLRLAVDVPPGTPPGGYRAAIFFTPPQAEGKTRTGANVFIQGRLALLIYVTVGGAKADGQIKAWEWRQVPPKKEQRLAFQVTNQGTAHLRLAGVAQVTDSQGDKFEALVPGVPVLPRQTRWIPLEFIEGRPSPGSEVNIEATIDLGQGEKKIRAQVGGRQ